MNASIVRGRSREPLTNLRDFVLAGAEAGKGRLDRARRISSSAAAELQAALLPPHLGGADLTRPRELGHAHDMKQLLIAALAVLGLATTTRALRAEDAREVTVFAPTSLREVFEDLAKTFEAKTGVKVRVNLAGSQELRTQIENGARADVFVSGDQTHMAALVKANLATAPRVFARNSPVVIVPKGNPAKVGSFDQLTRAKKLAIGVPELPIGSYALQILDKAGPDFKTKVLAHVASRELNARQVLAKVSQGEADAGIVYRTDALVGKDKVELIEIPTKVNMVTEYPVAVLSKAPQPSAAKAFVDLLLSADGRNRLVAAGFVAP